jgi:hypothetical protein
MFHDGYLPHCSRVSSELVLADGSAPVSDEEDVVAGAWLPLVPVVLVAGVVLPSPAVEALLAVSLVEVPPLLNRACRTAGSLKIASPS